MKKALEQGSEVVSWQLLDWSDSVQTFLRRAVKTLSGQIQWLPEASAGEAPV